MHSNRPILLVLCLISAIPLSLAQTPRSVDTQAVSIITQALSAAVAQSPTSSVQDSVAQGTIAFVNGKSATLKIESKGFKEVRQDITFSDHQISYVMNGGHGYSVRNGNKTDLPLWVTQYHYPEHIPLISQMGDFSSLLMNIKYVGLETLNGASVHHIRMNLSPADSTPADIAALTSEYHIFVDANTFMVVKSQSYVFSPETLDNYSVLEMYYSDYRSINGILVPFQISRFISGSKDCDISFSNVSLNVGLSDADFQ
jgi:hypothetical protein